MGVIVIITCHVNSFAKNNDKKTKMKTAEQKNKVEKTNFMYLERYDIVLINTSTNIGILF